MRILMLLSGTLLAVLALELAARALVRMRVAQLLRRVATPQSPLTTLLPHLPSDAVLPQLLIGRLGRVDLVCDRLDIPGLELQQVVMTLRDIRLGLTGEVRGGHGELTGRMPAEEVLARAGVPGDLELRDGAATLRWPARASRLPSFALRLRPKLDRDRIRLAPTPLSITLPLLPVGAVLTAVEAQEDALLVTASLDLRVLLAVARRE